MCVSRYALNSVCVCGGGVSGRRFCAWRVGVEGENDGVSRCFTCLLGGGCLKGVKEYSSNLAGCVGCSTAASGSCCWMAPPVMGCTYRTGNAYSKSTRKHASKQQLSLFVCASPSYPLQVSNVSCSCRAALAASSSALADKTSALQSQLTSTLTHFDTIMEGTADLQVEVTDEVRQTHTDSTHACWCW